MIINKFKPTNNTQYNNFSSILQLHSNNQTNFQKKTPRRKKDNEANQNNTESYQINIENSQGSNSHLLPPPGQREEDERQIGLPTPTGEPSQASQIQ